MAEKHVSDCIKSLQDAQRTDQDLREAVREAGHFLNKRDGQWEPQIVAKMGTKPRYTFDECNPIVDDIMGEMEQMSFDTRVNPAGGESSKDTAKTFEGIIRNIENISNAKYTYMEAARMMVGTGFNAWRVVQAYRDDNSFNQDLLIQPVPNVEDSLWFDQNAQKRTMEDADHCWVLSSMTKREYNKKYPDGSETSVGNSLRAQVYSYKKTHEIIIGEYLYKKEKERELALLSNNSVVVVDDDFDGVRDELLANNIQIVKTRKRKYNVVYQRLFDGHDWLTDDKETVFCYLPIVPIYGNFRISENKVIYWGVVEKLMDAQRVINYAESRKIEEGALGPRGKIWMPKDQAVSPDVIKTLRTLNTNTDPVQFYDYTEGQAAPTYQGSPVSNPGLKETSETSQNFIQRTSGTFDEARGTAPAHRSGTAIDKLQMKSDNPKRKWFTAVEIGLTHTGRILVDAIPKVYDTQQEMRLVNQDGSTDYVTLNQRVYDEQSREVIELYDLSKGKYDVICTAGPAFHSRQQETVTAINEMANIDPSILELGADVLLNNINAPGIDKIAERKRLQMVKAGVIPDNQLNQEELALVQQLRKQPPPENPMLVAAKAEAARVEGENRERELKMQIEQMKLAQKDMEVKLKGQIEAMKLDAQRQKQIVETLQAVSDQVKTQAEALKIIREAMGVDGIVDQTAILAFNKQANELLETVTQQ